jgi:carbonic anhydrase
LPTTHLKDGHQNYKNEFKKNEEQFLKLAREGQSPKVLWIGCSDSRVIPEKIMSANPGDIFTHRNIANIIPPKDSGENCTSSVIEYAVKHLNVEHIVICGHTECGGIKAVLSDQSNSEDKALVNWLKYANPAKEKLLNQNPNSEPDYLDTIKQNVLLQKENLLNYEYIKNKSQSGDIKIHAWLYDLHTGTISANNNKDNSWQNIV